MTKIARLIAFALVFMALGSAATTASAAVCYWNVPTGNVDEIANWIDDTLYPPANVPGADPTDVAWIANDGTATVTSSNLFGGTLANLNVGGAPGAGPTPMGTGNLIQTGGAVATSGVIVVGKGDVGGALSTYDLQGGSLTSGSAYSIIGDTGGDGKLKISGGVEGTPTTFSTTARLYVGWSGDATTVSHGTLEMSGYSSVTAGYAVYCGSGTAANGTVSMTGNAALSAPSSSSSYYTYIGNGTGAVGLWTMDGNSSATIGSNRTWIGNGSGASGTLTLSGDSTMTINGAATHRVGGGSSTATVIDKAVGVINLSGGTSDTDLGAKLTVNYNTSFGIWSNSEGTLNVHDYAEFYMPSTASAAFGDNSNDKGYTVSGVGNLNVDGHGKVTVGALNMGNFDFGVGNMTLSQNALVTATAHSGFGRVGGTADVEMYGFSAFYGTSGNLGGTYRSSTTKGGVVTLVMNDDARIQFSSFLNFGERKSSCDLTMNTRAAIQAGSMDIGWGIDTHSTANINTSSTITTTGNFNVGVKGDNAYGLINFNGDSALSAGGLWIGYEGVNAAGTMNVNTTADVTITMTSNTGANASKIGYDGGVGTLNLLDTTTFNATGGSLFVGSYNGDGFVTVSGSAQATVQDLQLGVNWQDAVANLGVGTVTVDGANAVVTVTGSATHINDDKIVDDVQTGHEFQDTLTIGAAGGVGTWNQNAGLTTCANTVILGEYDYYVWDTEWTAGNGTLNLNGGTFACGGISTRSNAAVIPGTVGTINFDGGTLKALADNGAFITADSTDATMTLNVLDGGVNIDTNGYNVGVNPGLVEDAVSTGGGLTKNGLGTLTLAGACTYTGATAVNAGGLAVDGSIMSNVTVDPTASLMGDGSITGDVDLNGTFVINYDSDLDTVDSLDILGALDLTGSTISFTDLGVGTGTLDGTSFVLATYASLTGVPTTTIGLPTGWILDYAVGGNSIVMTNTATPLPGDADNNGSVNDADAAILASHWLQSGPTIGWSNGDFNNDDVVDDRDAAILAAHWVRGTEGANVPEPGTLALLLAGLLALVAVRRGRK